MRKTKANKKTWWTVLLFYFLIAFEVFYMVSPFAVYYYSAYTNGLNFLNSSPLTQWLSSFFLPHIVVETKLTLLNMHNIIGGIIAVSGFLVFLIGACQIYYYKLTRRGAVTGGIYNFIRHPQYLALSVCGFGVLLVWSRYLVVVMYIAMLFAYYFLARAEERECEEKFGQAYVTYKEQTNMFLPFRIPFFERLPFKSGLIRFLSILIIFLLVETGAIGIARGLGNFSINNLYGFYTQDSATISVSALESNTMEKIIGLALANNEVQARIKNYSSEPGDKSINYILPADWYVAEIPMNKIENVRGHHSPQNYRANLYKVVFTQAELKASYKTIEKEIQGKEIILKTAKLAPIVEVTIDIMQDRVIKVENPPQKIRYENVLTPLF